MNFRDLIDRIQTSHPSAVIVTEGMNKKLIVTLHDLKVVAEVSNDARTVTVTRPLTGDVLVAQKREWEYEVSDELNRIWRKHEESRPKRPSGGGSYSGGGGGGYDGDDAVGDTWVDGDSGDDED